MTNAHRPATNAPWQAAWACHLTRPAHSFELAEQALSVAVTAGDQHSAAWAQLCKALAGYRWIGVDLDALSAHFRSAASAMDALADERGQRLASLGPAVLAMKRGQWPDALHEYEALVGHFDLGMMDADNFYALLGLSTSHIYCGNLAEGLRFGYAGLHATQQLGLAAEEVTMSLPLGVALMAARDLHESAAVFTAAENIAAEIDSPMLLKTVRNNLAVVLRRIGGSNNLAEAERLLKLVFAEPAAMIGGQQFAHFSAAELYILMYKLDLATMHCEAARKILSPKKIEPLDAAKLDMIEGVIASRRGGTANMIRAIDALKSVEAILPSLLAWRFSDRAKVFDELADALASQGRFEEAYVTQKKSSQDYLVNVDVLNRVRHVSMQVRNEMNRVQAALARESLERHQLQASHMQLRAEMDHAVRESQTLKAAAMHDALTGLPNRRYLDEALPNMLLLGKQTATPLAIAYLDLDRFKLVNDTYGHAMGDQVLQRFGALVPHFLRGSDLVGRHGGEEFCVALIGCGPDAASKRLKGLMDALQAEEFCSDTHKISAVTFSGGVAVYPDDGVDLAALMRAADRRLYAAKAAGRARIWCSD